MNLEIKREPLKLEDPKIADFEDLEWYIINSENAEDVFSKLKENKIDPVIFGLTDEGYEALSMNYADLRKHILAQHEIIIQYKEYYEPEEKSK